MALRHASAHIDIPLATLDTHAMTHLKESAGLLWIARYCLSFAPMNMCTSRFATKIPPPTRRRLHLAAAPRRMPTLLRG
jgi:hypothetical protein